MELTQIIILNWNGGLDTWASMNSVCNLPDVRITLVDNASSDNSIKIIKENLDALGLQYKELDATEVALLSDANDKIVIVKSSENAGFARGINQVLRPLLQRSDISYVWLLNNDAVAAPDALQHLITAMQSDKGIGFAGSMIMDGIRRNEIQCFGVRYYSWLGVGKMLFKGRRVDSLTGEEIDENPADFQHGASLLVRMDAIREIGLLDERFFLYSEEHDWQTRGAQFSYKNVRVGESKVYHLGSMSTARSKHLFYYYYCKSSVIYSRKHHAGLKPVVASMMLAAITAIRTRLHPRSFLWALKGMREAWKISL